MVSYITIAVITGIPPSFLLIDISGLQSHKRHIPRKKSEVLNKLFKIATPDTTFKKLYFYINDFIIANGFVNLDFLGNWGHSIVKKEVR